MKTAHFLYLLAFVIIATNILINACPTCIGQLERATPPFFSKEYDQHCNDCLLEEDESEQANLLQKERTATARQRS